MNLGKLLAAGKSIIGGRGEISYRISDRVYLPKFISPKNPFAPPVKVESAPNAPVTPVMPVMPVTHAAPAAPVTPGMASAGAKTQKLPLLPVKALRRRTWAGKLNPLLLWRSLRSSAPPKAQRPMQAELSLDRVKVVHNDLTDADVEVVPIKSRTVSEPETSILPPAPSGDSWSRLSAKIFGAKAA